MSHFVRIRTRLRERDHLIAALDALGLKHREGEALAVLSDKREAATAEIVVATGCQYEIGLRHEGDTFEVVADWYNIELLCHLRRKEFLDGLAQRYSHSVVREQAREQNLIVEEERQENGEIILVLSERG